MNIFCHKLSHLINGHIQAAVAGKIIKVAFSLKQPFIKELTLTVSLGAETVRLPDVVGEDVRRAESILHEIGLAVRTEVRTGAYPEGTVYAMHPRADTELPKGSMITLSVSAGVPAATVTVPDVVGMQRGEALTALWLAQLSVDEVIEEASDAEEGVVIRQNYQSGTVVMAGTRITLTVSRRKE